MGKVKKVWKATKEKAGKLKDKTLEAASKSPGKAMIIAGVVGSAVTFPIAYAFGKRAGKKQAEKEQQKKQ